MITLIENFGQEFLAFARQQSGPYNAVDLNNCALGQFVASKGFRGGFVEYYNDEDFSIPYPSNCMHAALTSDGDSPGGLNWYDLVCRLESLNERGEL